MKLWLSSSDNDAFARTLDVERVFALRARLPLDMPKLLSTMPAQQRAATTQAPRRPVGAGGERSEPVRLGVRDYTHALFAPKVQHKVSNGVTDLAAAGSSLDGPLAASGGHLWIRRNRANRARGLSDAAP